MEKSEAKLIKEKLFIDKKNAYLRLDESVVNKAYDFCEDYKDFLNKSKTEREAVKYAVAAAEKNGFKEYEFGKKYSAGDKVYVNNRGKAVMLAVIGSEDIANGVRVIAAHIDSPRLDMKQNPLYEDTGFAYFKTCYYGGIKKYQWTAVPLALHGVIIKSDGTSIEINIGEDEGDPCFVVNDLLPHLAVEQMKRSLSDGIKGEEINILIGSRPFKSDDESELVKINILKMLNDKYGITEYDFITAELEAVPLNKARDIGFDRSLIGSYGQDDRVCAYPALQAALACKNPAKTIITVLTDKEEIGSDGNTGLKAAYLENFITDLAKSGGREGYNVIAASKCLSADVNVGFDPCFPDVVDHKNCAYLNNGVVLTKYTGSRGKGGTSDASAEFIGEISRMLNSADVIWQTGELGKVDLGGGGTVSMFVARLGMDVLDIGVPVLSMHSPFETTSKLDIYMMYKAFCEFYK
ncbi:MAG TPA: aminopeptidase [Firmicutes bacterium]|nr:aminopeptidase [Bacillota bacterium]